MAAVAAEASTSKILAVSKFILLYWNYYCLLCVFLKHNACALILRYEVKCCSCVAYQTKTTFKTFTKWNYRLRNNFCFVHFLTVYVLVKYTTQHLKILYFSTFLFQKYFQYFFYYYIFYGLRFSKIELNISPG